MLTEELQRRVYYSEKQGELLVMENRRISAKRVVNKETTPYRSGRFYTIESQWFFSVRETQDQGPYSNKKEAEVKLEQYILGQEAMPRKSVKFEINNLKTR